MEGNINSFINLYANEIRNGNASIFVGAGFSKDVGFVDWRGLLEEAASNLSLDINQEHDLVTIAQYYVNENGRAGINKIIEDEFLKDINFSENHRIIARMPIQTYWTTNYDSLIEDALKDEGRTVDVKYRNEHLSITVPNRNAVVYKMHGDKSFPSDVILIKDDYESYYRKYSPFITSLCSELISKTFLFIGFSFTDPNIDFILSRMRVEYGASFCKQHYAIFKEINRDDYNTYDEYEYDRNKQNLFFSDLKKRYSIYPIVIKDYSEITQILKCIESKLNAKNIFISGSANQYGDDWNEQEARKFIELLSAQLIKKGYNIITGFGSGVGNYVISGTLKEIYMNEKKIDDNRLLLRPFPQDIVDVNTKQKLWTKYREDMISRAGISIFVFGNKQDENGNLVNANGIEEEFQISKNQEKYVVPIGCTGFVAKKIWTEIYENIGNYYKNSDEEFKRLFSLLNQKEDDIHNICDNVIGFISYLEKMYIK